MTNVALVVLDTLRRDAYEEYFDWLPGRYYSNAWSTSHWTVPVHGSLFTGKYPSEVGVCAGSQSLDCEDRVLPERLRENGYMTRCFSCNVNISPMYEFDRGFDVFELLGHQQHHMRHWHDPEIYDWSKFLDRYPPEYGSKRYIKAVTECITSDCSTIPSLLYGLDFKFDLRKRFLSDASDMGAKSVLKRLRNETFGESEFAFLNLMETHAPYRIPDEYTEIDEYDKPENPTNSVESVDMEPVKTRYSNSAEYLSTVYEDVFDTLTENFEYVITLSDHGELLGEHGFYEHTHGLYPELINVPVTVYGPGIDTEESRDMISLLDVHQTILSLTETDGTSRGRNLLTEPEPTEFLSEFHGFPYPSRHREKMRDWGMDDEEIDHLMTPLSAICIPETCYGYETTDGFVEAGDCSAENPRQRLKTKVDSLDKKVLDQGVQDVPEAVEENLKELGYM
jgi:arylsulfatase